MGYEIAFPDDVVPVKIKWSRSYDVDKVLSGEIQEDFDAYFYKITGHYSQYVKLFYIGKVFKQTISQRLSQPDHRTRQKKLGNNYPRHKIKIGLGIPEIARKTKEIIDDIESILIYSNWNENVGNAKKIYKCDIGKSQLLITNTGFYRPLHKISCKAVFVK